MATTTITKRNKKMIIGNEFFYASNGCATAYIPLPLQYTHESQVAAMKYTYYTDVGTQLFTSFEAISTSRFGITQCPVTFPGRLLLVT